MGLIKVISNNAISKTEKILKKTKDTHAFNNAMKKYAKRGIAALNNATPVDSGKTADSWKYEIIKDKEGVKLNFYNTNVVDGANVAILLQYGHATKNGHYVKGIDYINPALKPIFDDIAESAWKEVIKV